MSIASHRMTRQLSQSAALTPSRALWPLLAVCLVGLWPTVVSLARIWRNMFDYHHGVVIALIAVIWLWRIRREIDACSVRPVRAALPLVAIALLVWAIAYRANSELMQQMLLPVIAILAVYAAMGPQVARRAAAPIAYLYFAIPLWEQLLPFLQSLTTTVAETVLGVMGVPTQVEGHHVTIPSGHFSIVEGCSGKRYLMICARVRNAGRSDRAAALAPCARVAVDRGRTGVGHELAARRDDHLRRSRDPDAELPRGATSTARSAMRSSFRCCSRSCGPRAALAAVSNPRPHLRLPPRPSAAHGLPIGRS